MEREKIFQKKSPFDILREEKEAEGWRFMGREHLTETWFRNEGAKFVAVPVETEESLRARYVEEADRSDPENKHEVDLILDEHTEKLRSLKKLSSPEEFRSVLNNLLPEDKQYFIFVRIVK